MGTQKLYQISFSSRDARSDAISAAGAEGGFLLNAPDGDVLGGVCLNRLPGALGRAPAVDDSHLAM